MIRHAVLWACLAVSGLATLAVAEGDGGHGLTVPEIASATPDEGLAAWGRIHAVVSHPRCANCHVDEAGIPMWTGPEYETDGPHGMFVAAGQSRIGVETLPCQTCHITSEVPVRVERAAPGVNMDWQLAPAEFVWFGVAEAEICRQMRDPERNGGRDGAGLIEHILHDAEVGGFITWGFDPGPGREPAPGGLQAHLDDTATWVAAGLPCPGD